MAQSPDFDLSIIAANSGYTVRVQAAHAVGELRPQPFIPPVDLGALPRVHRDAAVWIKQARITRLAGSEELQAARAFGGALFERLFTGEVLAAFRASRAALPPRTRLRLRLRLPDSLTTLPWELVYDKRDNQFLTLAPDLMLVRYPELPTPVAPLRIAGPLQVVAVLASPRGDDYAPIRIDREQRRIEAALKSPMDQGALALEIISGPDTLGQLRERLRRPVHVLHILCHGDLDTDSGEGVLIFENVDGEAEPINAELLRLQLQKQQGQTRLVLLNACLGALPAGDDPFSSVGAALLRGGVPAVIAMQFELAEDAAAELTRIFYAELIAGVPSELALTEARQHLYGRYPTRLDWAIPVMFLRVDDGVLFDVRQPKIEIETARPTAPSLPPLGSSDPRILRAHVAALTDRWEEALTLYEELVSTFALPPGAIAELERARSEVWVLRAKAQAKEAAANDNWDAAIVLLEQVTKRQPDDADTLERLRNAREEQELATGAREAADMAQAGEWEAVAALLGKIEQRRASYIHPTIDLAALKLRAQAGLAYRRAVAQAEQNDWQAVIATLAAVPEAAAGQELRGLLAHARAKQKEITEAAEQERREQNKRQRLEQAARKQVREEQVERERQSARQIAGSASSTRVSSTAEDGRASEATAPARRKLWLGITIASVLGVSIMPVILALGVLGHPGSLKTARSAHTATLLKDGTVLVAGGCNKDDGTVPPGLVPEDRGFNECGNSLTSVEIYDPLRRTWRTANSLATACSGHTATLLMDGTVLLVGGSNTEDNKSYTPLDSAEIYDPAKGRWQLTSEMRAWARTGHTTTLLQDGTVLVAGADIGGGSILAGGTRFEDSNTELFDPISNKWQSTGNMKTGRNGHSATLLHDGTILVAGGASPLAKALASAEIYDPAKGTWHTIGSLAIARAYHTATLLQDGTVLIVGGESLLGKALASAEIYDPAKGTWRTTGSMSVARTAFSATLLQDGMVLVAGGTEYNGYESLASAEIYDPAKGTWRMTSRLTTARQRHTATLLNDGTVLLVGGDNHYNYLTSTEIYSPE